MYFELIGEIEKIEVIRTGHGIRDLVQLQKQYGAGRWRKLKGITHVQVSNRRIRLAEIHRYEAHGIGRKRMKIKRFLE